MLFSRTSGDQALLYLLLQEDVAYLHPRWNMRHHPVRSVTRLLNASFTGLVHFAGSKGVLKFCEHPGAYPILFKSAVPLYLSVVASLARKCLVNEQRFGIKPTSLVEMCGNITKQVLWRPNICGVKARLFLKGVD